MNERLKKIIFYKLYQDLKQVEIIPYYNEIWFIDIEQKFWYFIYNKNTNHLWWRWCYFENYFDYFSLEPSDAEYVMSRWVEEVLNSRVDTTHGDVQRLSRVEEVLNSRVDTTNFPYGIRSEQVEEVLNSRVDTTAIRPRNCWPGVKEVLNSRVDTTNFPYGIRSEQVEEVLNSRVDTTSKLDNRHEFQV